ncbi:hypothetical protein CFter6_0501 [Collimonas fungivorans]|uniref:Uncharacterized protein n=1 Tax=Collimonas fungivorans TaxID=158899 RepID=A0A127P5W7_9BURK|nr:hypothetical protein CFter6_0501 [Collimonas fungivorans]
MRCASKSRTLWVIRPRTSGIGEHARDGVGQANAPVDLEKQQNSAFADELAAVEGHFYGAASEPF